MKAKDTVMNDITKRQFIYIKDKPDNNLRGFLEDNALLAQAEISLLAGKKVITDWVEKHTTISGEAILITKKEWQTKLKEWRNKWQNERM